jgi:hypothetical protein
MSFFGINEVNQEESIMRSLEDTLAALNFRHIGKVLSKRPVGLVTGTFLFLVVVYVLVYGMWYSGITGDFIDAFADVSKPHMPSFRIMNGQLSMQSPEPFILTHEDFYNMIIEAAVEVDNKRFGGKNTADIDPEDIEAQLNAQRETFCLVMDTTGTYKEVIDPADFTRYAVITKDTAEFVDRVQSMPGNAVPIKNKVPQDVSFTPDRMDMIKNPLKRISTAVIIMGLFFYVPVRFLLKALIGAFIAWILILILKREIPFGALYKIGLYALAPVVLLAVAARFTTEIHGLIYQTVYLGYIAAAVFAVPKPAAPKPKVAPQ